MYEQDENLNDCGNGVQTHTGQETVHQEINLY